MYFERTYSLKTQRSFVLGFRKNSPGKDKTVVIDSDVFAAGTIRIKIDKEDLENIPEVKIG